VAAPDPGVMRVMHLLRSVERGLGASASARENLRLACLEWFFAPASPRLVARALQTRLWTAICVGDGADVQAHKYALASLASANEDARPGLKQLARQLKQDLARCHQYHPMVTAALPCLERVLLAWARNDPAREYWQGLDSMAAVLFVGLQAEEAATFAVRAVSLDGRGARD
jgi:hypothetical protein